MIKRLMIVVVFLCSNVFAWNTRIEFETATIRALQDKRYLISDDFRTNLLALIASPIDEVSVFEARIIQTEMNNEQYMQDMDFAKLEQEYVSVTNFIVTAQVPTNKWCSWGVPLALGAYYGIRADDELLFNLATNTIDKMVKGEIGSVTNAMSQAYLAKQKMNNVTPLQAFKALAVYMEHIRFHEIVRTASYTNDLPRRILVELLD